MLDTRGFSSFVRLGVSLRVPPPLDSKTGWTRELWSKTNLLKWQNIYLFQQKNKYFQHFQNFEKKKWMLVIFFFLSRFLVGLKLFFLTIFIIFGFFLYIYFFFFFRFVWNYWLLFWFIEIFIFDFFFYSKQLRLQRKLTEVTTEHHKLPKIS